MLTLNYNDFVLPQKVLQPSNETDCTSTPTESSSSDTVDSLNLKFFSIRHILLTAVKGGVNIADNRYD